MQITKVFRFIIVINVYVQNIQFYSFLRFFPYLLFIIFFFLLYVHENLSYFYTFFCFKSRMPNFHINDLTRIDCDPSIRKFHCQTSNKFPNRGLALQLRVNICSGWHD